MTRSEFENVLESSSAEELEDYIEQKYDLTGEQILALKRELKLRSEMNLINQIQKPKRLISKRVSFWDKMYFHINLKTILKAGLVSIIISGFVYSLILFPSFKPRDYEDYDRSVIGEIISIEEKEALSQSLTGTKEVVLAFVVTYTYSVNDIEYEKQIFIPNRLANKKYVDLLKANVGDEFKILYKKPTPEKSIPDIYRFDN